MPALRFSKYQFRSTAEGVPCLTDPEMVNSCFRDIARMLNGNLGAENCTGSGLPLAAFYSDSSSGVLVLQIATGTTTGILQLFNNPLKAMDIQEITAYRVDPSFVGHLEVATATAVTLDPQYGMPVNGTSAGYRYSAGGAVIAAGARVDLHVTTAGTTGITGLCIQYRMEHFAP